MNNEAQSQGQKKYNRIIVIGIILIALSLTPFILAEFGGRFYYPDSSIYMFFSAIVRILFWLTPLTALIIGFAIYKKHKLDTIGNVNVSNGNKLLKIIGFILATIVVPAFFIIWLVALTGA